MGTESCPNCLRYCVCGLPMAHCISNDVEHCVVYIGDDAFREAVYASWQFTEPDKHGNKKPYCSNCGKYNLSSWSDYIKCKVCPNCGAVMSNERNKVK